MNISIISMIFQVLILGSLNYTICSNDISSKWKYLSIFLKLKLMEFLMFEVEETQNF